MKNGVLKNENGRLKKTDGSQQPTANSQQLYAPYQLLIISTSHWLHHESFLIPFVHS
jgi:hypothetical protein